MDNKKGIYSLTIDGDNTFKQFMDRFYVIPKELKFTDEQQKFLNDYSCYIIDPDIATGKNCYIVRRKGKKLTKEQTEIIKNDTGSYRAKAKKYNLSLGTISKIMNNKY